ncbi:MULTISPECIES: hypothetical protein [Kurthia]|uniref:hypothetical protein n=1 Tax=Kurthia TaxID=1649 RepID=UPI000745EA4A|nr:hypothetical protein [Kurthia sp. 11kri321]AMA63364.1 putative membrane protein [Kurthia sp. 11kri321]
MKFKWDIFDTIIVLITLIGVLGDLLGLLHMKIEYLLFFIVAGILDFRSEKEKVGKIKTIVLYGINIILLLSIFIIK